MEIVEIMSADYLQTGNFCFFAHDYIDDVFRLDVFVKYEKCSVILKLEFNHV